MEGIIYKIFVFRVNRAKKRRITGRKTLRVQLKDLVYLLGPEQLIQLKVQLPAAYLSQSLCIL
jgi:hypothetical protein